MHPPPHRGSLRDDAEVEVGGGGERGSGGGVPRGQGRVVLAKKG